MYRTVVFSFACSVNKKPYDISRSTGAVWQQRTNTVVWYRTVPYSSLLFYSIIFPSQKTQQNIILTPHYCMTILRKKLHRRDTDPVRVQFSTFPYRTTKHVHRNYKKSISTLQTQTDEIKYTKYIVVFYFFFFFK